MPEWICSKCAEPHNSQTKLFLPAGWNYSEGSLHCPDCQNLGLDQRLGEGSEDGNTVVADIPIACTPSDQAIGAGVERFFAVPMPVRGAVSLFFDRGNIELTLAESEALSATLAGANALLRGAHPAQAGEVK